jgi:hypothetical protein
MTCPVNGARNIERRTTTGRFTLLLLLWQRKPQNDQRTEEERTANGREEDLFLPRANLGLNAHWLAEPVELDDRVPSL